ncbi:MAG: helix-turn-helix domain-containing protein [Vicinamibacteria bacterium]
MSQLMRYSWPGNVRELENVIERAAILATGNALAVDEAWLTPEAKDRNTRLAGSVAETTEGGTLAEMERRHILRVLEKSQWQIAGKGGAAEQLGLKPSTLRSRMEKLGLQRGN